MDIKRLSPALVEIDESVRIEEGPIRKTAVATVELFDAAELKDHYHLPKTQIVDGEEVTIVAKDSLGADIVEGQEFNYIDWNGDGKAFYVYQKDTDGVWQKIDEGTRDDYESALSFVSVLLK